MKKILILTYSLGKGGSELNAYKISKVLTNKSFDWYYLNDTNLDIKPLIQECENIDNILTLHFRGFKRFSFLSWLKSFSKQLKTNNYSTVYAIGFLPSVIICLIKVIFSLNIKIITTRRELMPWKRFYHIPFLWLINLKSDKIETNSKNIEQLLSKEFFTSNKVYYLPNILLKEHSHNSVSYFDKRKVYVGIVANVRPAKNFSLFLEIAHKLINKNSDLVFVIAGKDKDNLVHDYIQENKLDDRLIIYENIEYSEIFNFYAGLKIFLFTSRFEGSPNAVYEAISCGLPIVCSDIPATKEVIKEGLNGYLCDLGNPTSFIKAIEKLLSDEILYNKVRENNLQKYNDELKLEKIKHNLEKNFE